MALWICCSFVFLGCDSFMSVSVSHMTVGHLRPDHLFQIAAAAELKAWLHNVFKQYVEMLLLKYLTSTEHRNTSRYRHTKITRIDRCLSIDLRHWQSTQSQWIDTSDSFDSAMVQCTSRMSITRWKRDGSAIRPIRTPICVPTTRLARHNEGIVLGLLLFDMYSADSIATLSQHCCMRYIINMLTTRCCKAIWPNNETFEDAARWILKNWVLASFWILNTEELIYIGPQKTVPLLFLR